jgi:lipoyl(octanoyl) transferase
MGRPGTELEILHLGCVPYDAALRLQRELRDARLARRIGDVAVLLEHPDVVSFGRRSTAEERALAPDLRARGYEVHEAERGGQATYHGPGQLVAYVIADLATRGRDVHRFLRALEQAVIETASDFGVQAHARPGFTGVWVDEQRKLASIGIGIRRWVTLHGLALNVCSDAQRSAAIVPCGLAGVKVVSLSDMLGWRVEVGQVRPRLEAQLRKILA